MALGSFDDPSDEAQYSGAQPVIALCQAGISPVCGKKELGQIVGANGQKVNLGQQDVEHLGQSRDLKHRAITDFVG